MKNHDYKAALAAFRNQLNDLKKQFPAMEEDCFSHYYAAIDAIRIAEKVMNAHDEEVIGNIKKNLLKEVQDEANKLNEVKW